MSMEPSAETGGATEADRAERLAGQIERQRAELEAQAVRIAELETQAGRAAELEAAQGELRELRRLLAEAEQLLAELPELRRRSQELERISSSAEWRIATALRVPGTRAADMWFPAVRRRAKQFLRRLIQLVTSS
jgi:DNA repair exonuclease SbcCD ATPase subunit